MSFILNEYEVDDAQIKAAHDFGRPNLQKAVLTLARLVEWTNSHSDGWAYWSKPTAASTKLQGLVHDFYFHPWGSMDTHRDITAAELKAAETPVKAFLTRQGVNYREVFVNA